MGKCNIFKMLSNWLGITLIKQIEPEDRDFFEVGRSIGDLSG
jgi:hypothetical protein